MTDPLRHLVAGRAWDWLFELCRLLALDVELTDASCAPNLREAARSGPTGGLVPAPVLKRLRPALEAALASQQPQAASDGEKSIALHPIRFAGDGVGALVLARTGVRAEGGQHLQAFAPLLAAAVERHLESHVTSVELVGGLIETLAACSRDGSDRRIVEVFAEALAVWHDIDVVGYVETVSGVFVRAIALAGHGQTDPPLVFPPHAVPRPRVLTRMPLTGADTGSRAEGTDVWLTTLTRVGDSRWLLTFGGGIDACEPALVSAYVVTLDFVLSATARAERAELAMAIDRALAGGRSPLGLERALRLLQDALRATHVDFRTGEDESPVTSSSDSGAVAISVRRQALDGAFRVLSAQRQAPGVWTPRDQALAEAAADLLENQAAPGRPDIPVRSAEAAVAGAIGEILSRGLAATVSIFGLARVPTAASLSKSIAAEVSHDLRATDYVVPLPDTAEIAVVLSEAGGSPDGEVLERVRRNIHGAVARAGITILTEGVTTRMPGQNQADALTEARLQARL